MLITSAQVLSRITMRDAIKAVEQAIQRLAASEISVPVSLGVTTANGSFHVKACASIAAHAANIFVAKVNANFPGNPAIGRPTIQGVIAVFNAANGDVCAIVDSSSITSLRTAATTAVTIRHLAPLGARSATVVGCGALGRFHVEALKACGITRVFVFDLDFALANALAMWAREVHAIECEAVEDMRHATMRSQIVVTCTSSREPFLSIGDVRAGTFIAAVGADNENKAELTQELLASTRIVADLTAQCMKYGEVRRAPQRDVCGELTDVIAGHVTRTGENEIAIFDSTGLAVQDLALCELLVAPAK